jgi:hypothetical protein
MSSKHALRKDPICQNCGETVTHRFCSYCGQENTESRQTFRHLLMHFFEDITHYEGKFWKTMKYLFFRPAYLTREFLSGRRVSYVPPVRLYIFISFITFFLPYVLPNYEGIKHEIEKKQVSFLEDTTIYNSFSFHNNEEGMGLIIPNNFKSQEQLDSLMKHDPYFVIDDEYDYWMNQRFLRMQKYSPLELGEKFSDAFTQNFPKALFAYMPLFALVLTLFHRKKGWMYFDHAIFTLHYFSFLLLYVALTRIFDLSEFLVGADIFEKLNVFVYGSYLVSFPLYFLLAHKKMYSESWVKSIFKSFGIYLINILLFALVLAVLMFWAVISIH